MFGFPGIYGDIFDAISISESMEPAEGTFIPLTSEYLSGFVPKNFAPFCIWKLAKQILLYVINLSKPTTTAWIFGS